MPAPEITAYLDRVHANYQRLDHTRAYTALEVAESAHIQGHKLTKVVVMEIDAELALLLLPASDRIDIDQLRHSIRAFTLEVADASQFRNRFKDCEAGAIPPLGNLYGLDVYVAESLTHETEITFCAGSHSELIRMPYAEFAELVNPVVIRFGSAPIGPTPARMRQHSEHKF